MKKFFVLLIGFWLASSGLTLAGSASFDPQTNILHLPHLHLAGTSQAFSVDLQLDLGQMTFQIIEVKDPSPDGCYYGSIEGADSPYFLFFCVLEQRVPQAMVAGGDGEGFLLLNEGSFRDGRLSFSLETDEGPVKFEGNLSGETFSGTWVYAEGTPEEQRGTWSATHVE